MIPVKYTGTIERTHTYQREKFHFKPGEVKEIPKGLFRSLMKQSGSKYEVVSKDELPKPTIQTKSENVEKVQKVVTQPVKKKKGK